MNILKRCLNSLKKSYGEGKDIGAFYRELGGSTKKSAISEAKFSAMVMLGSIATGTIGAILVGGALLSGAAPTALIIGGLAFALSALSVANQMSSIAHEAGKVAGNKEEIKGSQNIARGDTPKLAAKGALCLGFRKCATPTEAELAALATPKPTTTPTPR